MCEDARLFEISLLRKEEMGALKTLAAAYIAGAGTPDEVQRRESA